MERSAIWRIALPAAIVSAVAQLVVAFLIPYWDDPDHAAGAQAVLDAGAFWTAIWLIHVAGIILLVLVMAIVTRTFTSGTAREWAGISLPFIAIGGALGMAETLTGASLGPLAEAWADAPAVDRAGYLAAYDAVGFATTSIDFGTIVIIALFLGMLGTAILASQTYARWIGWACLISGALTLGGILVELAIPDALWAIFAAQLLFIVATIAMARAIWRQADRLEDPGPHVAPANLVTAAPEGD